jgi:amino acid transporter
MNIGIMGVIPWRKAIDSTNIGTDAVEAVWGHMGGVIITVLIVTTAFASVYAGLLGASRLPYNAARDHLFFSPFGRLHPRLRFPHVSLLVMGVVTAIASLFSLQSILNALIAVSIVVQFIGGIGALVILRCKFLSLGRSALEWALVWMVLGVVAYLIWARYERVWPFGPKEIREAFLEEQKDSATAG